MSDELKEFLKSKFGVQDIANLSEEEWEKIQDKCEEMILDEVDGNDLTEDGKLMDDILDLDFESLQ